LIDLLHEHYANMMFCSDDKHPDSLALGHINQLCARAVAKNIDVFKVLQTACINPALHYNMSVGLLRQSDTADFIVVKDMINFEVEQTYINGVLVAANGKSLIQTKPAAVINNFNCNPITEQDIAYNVAEFSDTALVIEALDGQLITNKLAVKKEMLQSVDTNKPAQLVSNIKNDILKIVVVNRYHNAPIAKAFIKNFTLQQGAIASSVAHDSHNIVAVGVDDESICNAINLVIKEQGGVSAVMPEQLLQDDGQRNFTSMVVPLPIAGLMSNEDGYAVAAKYTAIDNMVKAKLGSTLSAPFMTLSFMALLVIPHLKLSDKGLFDGDGFRFISR
jgi:adenine deaminase